jgi:hypothetical protein
MGKNRLEGLAFKDEARKIDVSPADTLKAGEPDWNTPCSACGELPTVHPTGLCGPCCFGEADTAGGNW